MWKSSAPHSARFRAINAKFAKLGKEKGSTKGIQAAKGTDLQVLGIPYIIMMVFKGINILLALCALWALITCLRRPAHNFTYARRNKQFWSGILAAATAILAFGALTYFRLPMQGLLTFASVYAVVYYLGPEEQRMGR